MKGGGCIAIIMASLLLMTAPVAMADVDSEETADAEPSFPDGGSDGYFVKNMGQWDDDIRYAASTSFGNILLGEDFIRWDIKRSHRSGGHLLEYEMEGSRGSAPSGEGQPVTTVNYFLGNDPGRWVTGVPCYSSVNYVNVWNGIDIEFSFQDNRPKYDILLSPSSDVNDVLFNVRGADSVTTGGDSMRITENGVPLFGETDLVTFYEDDPHKTIGSSFKKTGSSSFGFKLEHHDPKERIVIDPFVTSTYLGGSESDSVDDLAVDSNGELYMIGSVSSDDFPTVPGEYDTEISGATDLFVTKVDGRFGGIIYTTYIGGSASETSGAGLEIINGKLVCSGRSGSSNFPLSNDAHDTTLGGYYDMVLFKLSMDGKTLHYSSYFGGSEYEIPAGMEPSSDGGVYLYGSTSSSNLPATEGAYQEVPAGSNDVFVCKFSSTGSPRWCTFFGSTGYDTAGGICEASDGDIYITGASSSDVPVTEDAYDTTLAGNKEGFVARISDSGKTLAASTYFGGSDSDEASDVMETSDGNICVIGSTRSDDMETDTDSYMSSNNGDYDMFLMVMDSELTTLYHSTYLGGMATEWPYEIMEGNTGDLIIAARTSSFDIPVTDNAEQGSFGGHRDTYIAILSSDLSFLSRSTYYGGTDWEYFGGMVLSDTGYLCVAGQTNSTDLPTTGNCIQDSNHGSWDCYLFAMRMVSISEPTDVTHFAAYRSDSYSTEGKSFDKGQRIYLELRGTDSDPRSMNGCVVNWTRTDVFANMRTVLVETGANTGIYRGFIPVPLTSSYFDRIEMISAADPSVRIKCIVEPPYRPLEVRSITVSDSVTIAQNSEKIDLGQIAHVRVMGTDSNPVRKDRALVNVSSDKNSSMDHILVLREVSASSGDYRGTLDIGPGMDYFENITLESVRDPSLKTSFMVHTPLQIRVDGDHENALEDSEYSVRLWNFGYNQGEWDPVTIPSWLEWDPYSGIISGTPDNSKVGTWEVQVDIEDDQYHSDSFRYRIDVTNTPPIILTDNVLNATEETEYRVDYDSDDDMHGSVDWSLSTSADWLAIDRETGVLSGTPTNQDAGYAMVHVVARDDNDGVNGTLFNLTIHNKNLAPLITTTDITSAEQDEKFFRNYEAIDEDEGDTLTWSLVTDAEWLSIDEVTGILSGTPGTEDVGIFDVNVSVSDPEGSMDVHIFRIEVEDVNDRPRWIDVPEDDIIDHGEVYTFDVNATDPETPDLLEYSLTTDPDSRMDIDPVSGSVQWLATTSIFQEDRGDIQVNIKVSDGEMFTVHRFTISVLPSEAPTSTLLGPIEEERAPFDHALLRWTAVDPEDDHLTYFIYMDRERDTVSGMREGSLLLQIDNSTEHRVDGLDPGTTYYWTVIPHDTCSYGRCSNLVWSFTTNNPPEVSNHGEREAVVGQEFSMYVRAEDPDADTLSFELLDAPEGMTVDGETGRISFTPDPDQEGSHEILMSVSDGIDGKEISFVVNVKEADDRGIPVLPIAMGVAALLVLISVIALVVIRSGKKDDHEPEDDEESRRIREEIDEKRRREKEEEEAEEASDSIATSLQEAHARDRSGSNMSYQDLYGTPAPEDEGEALSTRELKNEIHGYVEQLERMKY